MKKTIVKENWNEFSEKLQDRFPRLTYKDLLYKEGFEEELVEKIRLRLGKTKEDVFELLDTMQTTKD